MLAILNYLNAHNFPIFQPILKILTSKYMVHRALSDKTYLQLGLLSPLINLIVHEHSCKILSSLYYYYYCQMIYSKTCVKRPLSKNRKLVFKTNYAKCRSKVLQNAPRGAFCNTFDLH